jgi:hypothetical protein
MEYSLQKRIGLWFSGYQILQLTTHIPQTLLVAQKSNKAYYFF